MASSLRAIRINRLLPSRFTPLIPRSTYTASAAQRHSHGVGSSSDKEQLDKFNKPALAKFVTEQTDTALVITRQLLLNQTGDSNLVCSPLSMQNVLSFFNVNNNKSTHSSLKSKLLSRVFADGSKSGGPKLKHASGLWVDHSIHLDPRLAEEAAALGEVNRVDFATEDEQVASDVNSWVEKETNGLIKGAVTSGSKFRIMRLLFVNALYFKGIWNEEFHASRTRKDDFYLLNGSPVKEVPFMSSSDAQFIGVFDGFKVLKLLYKRGKDCSRLYSMCVFLPDSKDGLQALVEKISASSGFLERHIPKGMVPVADFRIPKFKFSFKFDASDVLESSGLMGDGWRELVKSRVGEPLFRPIIFQKSAIEVNEKGTKAVAVTYFEAEETAGPCPPPEPVDFVADHPFLFVIREEMTETVLFIGYVLNPLLGS